MGDGSWMDGTVYEGKDEDKQQDWLQHKGCAGI
jgi:hypothetical protein